MVGWRLRDRLAKHVTRLLEAAEVVLDETKIRVTLGTRLEHERACERLGSFFEIAHQQEGTAQVVQRPNVIRGKNRCALIGHCRFLCTADGKQEAAVRTMSHRVARLCGNRALKSLVGLD